MTTADYVLLAFAVPLVAWACGLAFAIGFFRVKERYQRRFMDFITTEESNNGKSTDR